MLTWSPTLSATGVFFFLFGVSIVHGVGGRADLKSVEDRQDQEVKRLCVRSEACAHYSAMIRLLCCTKVPCQFDAFQRALNMHSSTHSLIFPSVLFAQLRS